MINIRPEVLEAFKKYIEENPDQSMSDVIDENYLNFIKLFPSDKISELNLENYCLGNPDDYPNSFCWWLEHGLTSSVGKYTPGNSNRHFIYWDKKDKQYKKNVTLSHLSDEDAMLEVAKLHAYVANLSPKENLDLLDNDRELAINAGVPNNLALGNARKLRLTQIYHPEYLVNINSLAHMKSYLLFLGATKTEIKDLKEQPYKTAFLLRQYYLKLNDLLLDLGGLSINTFGKLWYTDIFDSLLNDIWGDSSDSQNIKQSQCVEAYLNIPLNQILYGPPGTGKTYKTVEEAVAICDPDFKYDSREQLKKRYDDLIENNQISFVTFHQSFSYEDFVEGIRAKTEAGQIEYTVEDGIFKGIVKRANQKILSNIWKLAFVDDQRQNKKIEQECLENNYILLRYSNCFNEDNTVVVDTKYRQDMESSFMDEMQIGDLVLISDGVKNIRAIAEIISEPKLLENIDRDTYKIKRDVKWLSKFDKPISNEDIVTQKFKHDALYLLDQTILKVDGLQKVINKNLVLNESKKNYVLIIDEINRGNIANIFGELITLLEPSKRAGNDDARSVILPYSKESFSVPNNLYVIGTMNTSDHSLTKLDLALRRRFEFVELLPDYSLLNDIEVHGVKMNEMLQIMNDRIEILLGRDYLIGHSYFLPLKDSDDKEEVLADIFKNKIIPLLQEYFFEDWERIQWVLNDQNKKNDNLKFIKLLKDNNKDYLTQLFGNLSELNHIPDRRYQINAKAFEQPQAYQQIIKIKESE